MKISILLDNPKSWYAPYAQQLAIALEERGHSVARPSTVQELQKGNVAFFLSCEQIITPEFLALHEYNIVIHASKVPEGKGWSPMAWQILEGKNEITVSLFEAAEAVDAGDVYDRQTIDFAGHELIDELRMKEARAIEILALRFIDSFPPAHKEPQNGKSTYFRRRTPDDSRLDPHKTIAEQFDLMRVVDNDRYPAFFEYRGHTYILKITKRP